MKKRIYADHAATTPLDKEALRAMLPYFCEEYGNPSALYRAAKNPRNAVRQAREVIADCIGAKPEEIFFTSGGSESDNWALKGKAFQDPKKKIHIITSEIEHHAILRSCAFLAGLGYQISYLPVDRAGLVSSLDLERIITSNSLVSIMLANNETGTVEPIQEFATLAHRYGAVFHTDAVQAVGHIPIHVEALGIDLLSASAHKFHGPRGIGFLYKRSGVALCPLIHGGGQEHGYRAGTENVAGIMGMAKALELSCKQMERTTDYLLNLRQSFKQMLDGWGIDYRLNEASDYLPGTISLSVKNMDGERLLHHLDLMGVEVSTGSACNSQTSELSHVLKALHLPKEYAYGTIRITLGQDNTLDDVKKIAAAIAKVVRLS